MKSVVKHKDSSEKSLTQPVRLNVKERIKTVEENAFPWNYELSVTKKEWPYILQSPLKPKKYKRKNKLPEKKGQTEQKWFPKTQPLKKPFSKEAFSWEPPEEKMSAKTLSSFSDIRTTSSKTLINMDVLFKKIESKSKFLENNTLPKYVLTKSSTSIPNWVEKNVPENIKPETLIQAGKPWHKRNECTWAKESKIISPLPRGETYSSTINKKSPKVDWGPSICSLQKKKFDNEYRKRKKKKKLKSVSIHKKINDKDHSCKAFFYYSIFKKKVLEPIVLTNDVPSTRSLSPYESLADVTSPLFLPHGLHTLSYTKKDDQKKKYNQPDVVGIEKPWEYLTERIWPPNIAKTVLFNSLVKTQAGIPTVDSTKYPVFGQWPYVDNMVKTINVTTGTFKTKPNYSFEGNFRKSFSSNRNLEYGGKGKKRRASSLVIPPIINPVKKIDEYYNYKQQSQISELGQDAEIIPSTLNQQKLFPGFIEYQPTLIKPLSTKAPFTYELSNLHLYELNYTYLTQKQTYLRTLIYYSTFNNKITYDPFQVITTKRYKNKMPYLDVPSSGLATIYYPSGKVAIQCAYSSIENRPDLLARRYTIRNEATQRVEAIFDSLGNGIVYDKKGNSIMNYSQNFGVSIQNNQLFKWRWHNIPVTDEIYTEEIDLLQHSPTIPNTEVEEMLLRNVNIYERFTRIASSTDNDKSIKSLDSNNSLQEQLNPIAHKSGGEINYGIVTPLKPFTIKINEYMKLYIKNQKHIELKFQANEIKLTIQLGILLNPKIVLSRENLEYNLIPHEKILCKFDKIIGNTRSLIKILKFVGDGKKLTPLKYKTQLIDFNDKVNNLIEDETSDKVKNPFEETIKPTSDHTLRVQHKDTKSTTTKSIKNEGVIQDTNKLKDEDNTNTQSGEEKESPDIEISKFYHVDNLLEGSNPIASNISLLINNKTKLKQFLYESKHRK